MPLWFSQRRLDASERKLDCAREILDAGLTTFLRFARLDGLGARSRPAMRAGSGPATECRNTLHASVFRFRNGRETLGTCRAHRPR